MYRKVRAEPRRYTGNESSQGQLTMHPDLNPDDAAALTQLYADFAAATLHTATILAAKGIGSREFYEADRAAASLLKRIRAIIGTTGKHWVDD